jgi:hypothetical protein
LNINTAANQLRWWSTIRFDGEIAAALTRTVAVVRRGAPALVDVVGQTG